MKMTEIVEKYLHRMQTLFEYEVHPSGNPHSFYFDQEFEHGLMRGVIGVHYEDELVYIFRLFPTTLSRERKSALLEYVVRINSNNLHGTFQLDLEDMTMGIDATFSISNDEAHNQKQLNTYFHAITDGLDKYFEGALKVGFGDKDPSLVLNQLEYNTDPRLN